MKKLLHFSEPQDNVSIVVLIFFARCTALTAYNALNGSVPVGAGDYVLVLGTGGVSMSAHFFSSFFNGIYLYYIIQFHSSICRRCGSYCYCNILFWWKTQNCLSSKLGAKYIINYKTTPKWDEEIQKIVCCASCPYSHIFKWQHLNYNQQCRRGPRHWSELWHASSFFKLAFSPTGGLPLGGRNRNITKVHKFSTSRRPRLCHWRRFICERLYGFGNIFAKHSL